jgi:hypothetical protein
LVFDFYSDIGEIEVSSPACFFMDFSDSISRVGVVDGARWEFEFELKEY